VATEPTKMTAIAMVMVETYTTSKDANMMSSTTRRESTTRPSTASKNKAAPTPTDVDALSSMANADTMISQVAVLLADLHDSALMLSPAKDDKPKKSSQKPNQTGVASVTTKSPASCSHRPVVVAKDEGAYRGDDRDGNIHTSVSTRTSTTSTKPVPGKVQGVKETDDYTYGPVQLEPAPKVPTRRHKNGSHVRSRGRAPKRHAWDVIRGVRVLATSSNKTASSISSSSNSRGGTTDPTGTIDSDSDSDEDSSRTLGGDHVDNDDDDDDDSLDAAGGDCDNGGS
jgi:hypothetical protein